MRRGSHQLKATELKYRSWDLNLAMSDFTAVWEFSVENGTSVTR